jgi:hypothetical protein
MNAVITEQLVDVARAARAAGHGGKEAIYAAACERLGLSRAALFRNLKEVTVNTSRKQRSDAGKTALSREEALVISGVLMESAKKNDKQLYTVADAVHVLRRNDFIKAEYLDEATGEIKKMSDSAIARALRMYGLHPDQLLAPAPCVELKVDHVNHVWEIDASLCVLYYLKPSANPLENGLRVMKQEEFYKNKPKNVARIMSDRIWSYELTEKASGWIYAEYVMGAESGENLCDVLINAMQERGGNDILHGVPRILYMDKGSAMTAGMTKNLCRSLGIKIESHAAGNARATGQVEKARDILERKFEGGLKFIAVPDLTGMNALVKKWREHYNATAIHSRHGKTRSEVWMSIKADQLIKAPPVEVCRELAVAVAESRKVTPKLRVSFQGQEYDVSSVPNVMVGEKVMVTRNPWRNDAAQVVMTDADGNEVYHICPRVEKGEFGYATTAVTIGECFKRHADTPAQTAMKEIEQLVTGTDSLEAAKAARKGKALPFGGQLDPYKHIEEDKLPTFMPRRGTQHELVAPKVEMPKLSHVALAKKLKAKLGGGWTAESYQWLVRTYPDGATENDVEGIAARMTERPKLLLVAGGGR